MGFNASYSVGGKIDKLPHPFFPMFKRLEVIGRRIEVPGGIFGRYRESISFPRNVELVSISVSATAYKDPDFWDLYVGSTKIYNTIYIKEYAEVKNPIVVIPVNAGEEILFEFVNDSKTSKVIWIDFEILY